MRLLCSLLTVAACLGPSLAQAQTCEQRFQNERTLIVGLLTVPLQNLVSAANSILVAHDALKAANCLQDPAPPPPPTLACPAPQTATSSNTAPIVVMYPAPMVVNGQAPFAGPNCAPASGALFPVGATAVQCTVSDALQRSAQCSTSVTVTVVPPQGQTSPQGFRAPRDGPSLIAADKRVWSVGLPGNCGGGFAHPEWCKQILIDNLAAPSIFGFEIVIWDQAIYVRGDDALYYKLVGPGLTFAFYGAKGPDETVVVIPPACSDGIDNDRDGKIDFPADPGCLSPQDSDETDPPPGGARAVADHSGLLAQLNDATGKPIPGAFHDLVFDLYVDAVKVSRSTKAEAWDSGRVTIPLPAALARGTHAVRVAAHYICPPASWCAGSETMPPVWACQPTTVEPSCQTTVAYEQP